MHRAGLLILTQPLAKSRQQIPVILDEISQMIKETLYVHIQPNTNKINPVDWTISKVPCTQEIQNYIREFYSSSASRCMTLDVRILLGHITNAEISVKTLMHKINKGYDTVLFDNYGQNSKNLSQEILGKIKEIYPVETTDIPVLQLKNLQSVTLNESLTEKESLVKTYDFVALGGTFDRLHSGHKVLLNEGCLLCDKKLTVGVTEKEMNQKKVLRELIEPIEDRKMAVKHFINDIRPQIEANVVGISDLYGPTITDQSLQLIVLSEETVKGGTLINEERKKKSFSQLEEVVINLLEDPCHAASEEAKVSSSSLRRRLLGTVYNTIQAPGPEVPDSPYLIGLTGGICSGKSTICKKLQSLGAGIVDCDKLGHAAYQKDTPAFKSIIEAFGDGVLSETGEIDRRKLGPIVFSDPSQLKKLNGIVWPEIGRLAREQIQQYEKEGKNIVVLDAAVLLEAEWNKMVHEVWTAVVPQSEAVLRIMERNGLSEEEALKRVKSQMSNEDRVAKSNVIFCSLWEYEYTQGQVERAWKLLQERINTRK
ncbi:hypothetical protein SNE40_023399 [Patella caerulea]|uniref:Bifunctional coenzyme A synthase n=1 Tax=Patella caerulea TaxID=87958 RepID=A0AAN8FYE9_PATCE